MFGKKSQKNAHNAKQNKRSNAEVSNEQMTTNSNSANKKSSTKNCK